jgi:aryl-alcohol dehydrogenase-like predicted oxidoreductase
MLAMRTLGPGGPPVSRLGLGLAALGRPGYINLGHAVDLGGNYDPNAMRDAAHGVLDAAWDRGVRYFDAARSYGRGEEFLGTWLEARGLRREDATVGSKWGYVYTAGWKADAEVHEVKDHSIGVYERQIGETRANLGDRLAVYHIHSATLDSGALDRPEVLRAMAGLREQGVLPGLSLSGTGQAETLRRAMDVEIDGRPVFGCVQATWNVLEPSAGEALAEAHAAGWGVIVKEALANGRLTPRNREAESTALFARLTALAEEQGVGVDAAALAAALAQPWADVVLSGAGTAEQLESNLEASRVQVQAEELLAFAEAPDFYWKKRAALAWN